MQNGPRVEPGETGYRPHPRHAGPDLSGVPDSVMPDLIRQKVRPGTGRETGLGHPSCPFGIIQPDWSVPANVRAFTTTRNGGFSKGQWSGLNLGGSCGDDLNHVKQNRALLQTLLPCEPHWLRQVHGRKVVVWDNGFDSGLEADAIVSNQTRQVCAVLTADCLPVLFCNKAGTKVAASHAGWRGLAAGVLEATISSMGCEPCKLMAWLGPAIGPTAFEVGEDVHSTFLRVDPDNATAFSPHNDSWLADLYGLARLALKRVGVEQVAGGLYCTYTDQDKFFSYRRDGETGRMATVIWLDD